MYNFINHINLQKIISSKIIDDNRLDFYVHSYLMNLYGRILELCNQQNKTMEAIKIQQSYFGENIMLPINDYFNKRIDLEKHILNKIPIEQNYELIRKEDQSAVVNFLLNEYKEMLNKELLKSSKDNMLIIFYAIASALSYISVASTYIFKHNSDDSKDKDINVLNMIIDTIWLIHFEVEIEINEILGIQKKCCEYLISYILNEKLNYADDEKVALDINSVFLITDNIVNTFIIKKSINNLFAYGAKIKIHDNTLCFHNDFNNKVKLYLKDVCDYVIDIDSKEANSIFFKFEKEEGYSIKILDNYLTTSHNKQLNTQCIINIVEDKFLYYDMKKITGADTECIKKLIKTISLKKPEKNFEDTILSTDNRIFRTPIIPVGNYFILSHFLLIESNHYLRYRVLKKELSKSGNLNKKIQKSYDEKELVDLKNLIFKYGVLGDINLKLDRISELKSLFIEKGITKEIDFYFIFNKTLYTMEFKNQDIDSSIYDISKSYSRNKSYKNKHLRMVEIIKKNISIIQKVVGKEICDIKSFLVFKYKNSFSDFYMGNDIYSCSYKEFYNWCEDLLKSNK